MLERTAAAGLETSGRLQRIFPRPTRRPRHNVARVASGLAVCHAGFSTLTVERDAAESFLGNSGRPPCQLPPLRLDFLLPTPTRTLLRRPSLRTSNRSLNRAHGIRPLSSHAEARLRDPSPHDQLQLSGPSRPRDEVDPTQPQLSWDDDAELQPTETYTMKESSTQWDEPSIAVDKVIRAAEAEADSQQLNKGGSRLRELLADDEGDLFHEVWDLYCHTNDEQRASLQPRVVSYLSRSRSVIETGRAMSLFRQIPIERWDNDMLSAAVLIILRAGNQSYALEIFKTGLTERGLIGGFEYLLLDTVNKQHWATTLDIWVTYCDHHSRLDPQFEPDVELLEPISSLPNLGALYFSFERYLARKESREERRLDAEATSKLALRLLRRRFATEALYQHCPPKQGATILEFWHDPALYERYLCSMFSRWYTKGISKSTARMLIPIYDNYRQMPGAKPSIEVLRGVFKVHYPANSTALEQLHRDWIQIWGGLNHWGYDKFLKYYAHKGDVTAVRTLWDRYVEEFPSRLKTPRGFRSTMNVYAQIGDRKGAEAEFNRMANHYGVKPDIDIWNTLLKCYVRTGDYAKVLSCFEEICSREQPDSFTYAHTMTMCANKGDLDAVLELFNDAQRHGVEITREMAMALVIAYCQNDKLIEAEEICISLAQRGVTSTEIWNRLLGHNAMHGRLSQCYELLNSMKRFNVEWDHETIATLLRALVRVRQMYPAFRLLSDSLKDQHHIVQPRHFAIVMLGVIKSANRGMAEMLMSLMEKAKVTVPFNARVAYAQTNLDSAPDTIRASGQGKEIVESLQALATEYHGGKGDLRRRRRDIMTLGRAVHVLAQLRDFTGIEKLMNIHADMFPHEQNEPLRQDVTAALMLAYHKDENYEAVHELWKDVWPKLLQRATKLGGGGIYPSHEMDVTQLVFRMAETFKTEGDGDGLLKLVQEVLDAGFKFTSSTWNRITCYLAELGHFERAMAWYEELLMPQWLGWYPRKQTLEARREAFNERWLRPTNEAILALQKEWLEMRKLSAWSAAVSRRLNEMEMKYPLLHHAFLTSRSNDVEGPWVIRGDAKLDEAISDLLRHLSRAELRAMEKALVRVLEDSPMDAPFQRATKVDGASSAALREAELKQLKSLLEETLAKDRFAKGRLIKGQSTAAPKTADDRSADTSKADPSRAEVGKVNAR